MAGKPSHPTTAPRLSKHLACLCHACCFGASSVAPLSPRRVTTRLCCRSLFLGTYGTRHNVAPPLGLCSSQWDSAFATMSSLSTSLLPLRSSLVRHATPCSGSCSCVAFIVSCPSNRSLLCLFSRAKRSRFLSAWVTARRFFQNLVAFAYTQRIWPV